MNLMPAHQMAMDLGLLTRPGGQDLICKSVDCGGASPVVALKEACQLLKEENLGCVAVIGADAVGSMKTAEFLRRVGGANPKDPMIPRKYDDFADWHMRTFGTTRQQLASVPTFMSMQALRNPGAFSSGKSISESDVLNSGRIGANTNLYECAKRADGAAVIIVCSAAFARERDMLHRSVPVLGIGEASGALMPPAEYIGVHSLPIHLASRRALEKAGLSAKDMDWFGLYDCFPVAFISALEQVGLCRYGEGGKWVLDAVKRVKTGKKVNVNTHGGLLGAGAPWEAPAMFTLVEAVHQILGRCGPQRQINGVRRALVQANGGTFSHEAVAILGSPQSTPRFPMGGKGSTSTNKSNGGPDCFPTSLTSMLGMKYPIMCAGMTGVARARLTAEVSEAGGMGCIGAAFLSVDQMREEIEEVKRLTKKPFAVNVIAVEEHFSLDEKAKIIATSGAAAFVTGLGVAKSAVKYMHDNGVLVGVVCGQVKHAQAAVRAGCDFIIAQGTEAGGHTGNIALFTLLPQVRAAVPSHIPVLAAGGVHDGQSFVAALSLGAAGVWMGSRFLGSFEANTIKGYKELLLPATSQDTTISRYYTGKPCRVLKNNQTREFEESGEAPLQFPEQYNKSKAEGNNHLFDGKPETGGVKLDRDFMPAGQVVGSIDQILPARLIVQSIIREARQVISNLQKIENKVTSKL
jgi:enoyl-[acyl-carrier protein] reductase II